MIVVRKALYRILILKSSPLKPLLMFMYDYVNFLERDWTPYKHYSEFMLT